MSLRSELELLPPAKLIEALSIRIYERPLCVARERLHQVSDPLRVPILVLDFDTEVSMNGVLGFLENRTGLFLPETIDAFERIGASETAAVLRAIQGTLEKHGVTPSKLRAEFVGAEPYTVTTFRELHGNLGTMPNEVEQDARRLYLYGNPETREPVWSLLEAFVEENRATLLAEIARVAGD
jgi:hypothetical protein